MVTQSPRPDPAYAEANRDVAQRVVNRLTATGLLGDLAVGDPAGVCREAAKVRDFLNMEIPNVRGTGPLDDSFKRMRRSARDFVVAGGADAGTYRDDPAFFEVCLQAMRLTLDDETAALLDAFIAR